MTYRPEFSLTEQSACLVGFARVRASGCLPRSGGVRHERHRHSASALSLPLPLPAIFGRSCVVPAGDLADRLIGWVMP